MKLKKWAEIYPQGTQEGDEEYLFFVNLERSPKYIWRSTATIANDSGLSKVRVEQIIDKYFKLGLIYPNPKNDESWAYWERLPEDFFPKKHKSLVEKDQELRKKKYLDK
jgi:hypothetical protein